MKIRQGSRGSLSYAILPYSGASQSSSAIGRDIPTSYSVQKTSTPIYFSIQHSHMPDFRIFRVLI